MNYKVLFTLFAACGFSACSSSNNLLLGRVNTTVGAHHVTVTDCYRTSVPEPEKTSSGYQWTPCKDADVQFHDEQLVVNGQSYGHVNPNDAVLVDHGKVSVNAKGN